MSRYGEVATIKLDEVDVAIMNGLIKDARIIETPDHFDSWLDKAGYAACGLEVTRPVPVEEMDWDDVSVDRTPMAFWSTEPEVADDTIVWSGNIPASEAIAARTKSVPFSSGEVVEHANGCAVFIGGRCGCFASDA